MENSSHEEALLDIHLSKLKLITRQFYLLGGPVYSPIHIIHQYIDVMSNIRKLSSDEVIPVQTNTETEAYFKKVQDLAREKTNDFLSGKKDLSEHTIKLINIHCINLAHLENQQQAPDSPHKLPQEATKILIEQEHENISSLI